MDYLIISPCALSMFAVPRLGRSPEVNKIYFCITDPSMSHVGMGMENVKGWEKMEKVSDPFEKILNHSPSNLIIFIDDVGIGYLAHQLRFLGFKVIGGSPLTDKLENDRQAATEYMKKIMKVPETYFFTSFEDGIHFLRARDKTERWIFKPHDSYVPKEYTYVSKDVNDLLEAMKSFKEDWNYKEDFQLQKHVKGTEVDFSGWWNGKDYLPNSLVIYFENKPLMNDDIGPATGGSIAVEFMRPMKGIFADILEKIKPILIKSGYIGEIGINSIVSEEDKQPYFLEYTSRTGYPSFPLDITLIEDNKKTLHDLFDALANGKNSDVFPTNKAAVTVSVSVAPTSTWKMGLETLKGKKIDWSEKYDDYFFPYFIMNDEKKGKVLAGVSSEVLNVTCIDKTIDGAVSMLYEKYMPTLELQGALYRTDLGVDAKKRIKALKEMGLFNE